MAHRLLEEPINEGKSKRKLWKLPNIGGKFGVAVFIGGKEYFFGLSVADVEIEQVVKRRFVKPSAKVKVYRFDSL